jgi:hypothetical protein
MRPISLFCAVLGAAAVAPALSSCAAISMVSPTAARPSYCHDAPPAAIEKIKADTNHVYATAGLSVNADLPLGFRAIDLKASEQKFGFTKIVAVQSLGEMLGRVDKETGEWVLKTGPTDATFGMDFSSIYFTQHFLSDDTGEHVVALVDAHARGVAHHESGLTTPQTTLDAERSDREGWVEEMHDRFPTLSMRTDPEFVAYADALTDWEGGQGKALSRSLECVMPGNGNWPVPSPKPVPKMPEGVKVRVEK